MKWLERLKALRTEEGEPPRHRQNRQNPGSVSFGSAGGGDHYARGEGAATLDQDGGLPRQPAERLAGLGGAPADPAPRWGWPWQAWGDLRPCLACASFARSGLCLAAARQELRAARDYMPGMPQNPTRCVGYLPGRDDPDQRPGYERWPYYVAADGGPALGKPKAGSGEPSRAVSQAICESVEGAGNG